MIRHVLVILLSLLTACASSSDMNKQAVNASVVSVRHNMISVPYKASFRWKTNHIRFYHNHKLAHADIDVLLQQSIEQTLVNKGYRYSPNAKRTDFVIAYAAALESDLDNQQVLKQYGLQPGLMQNSSKHYEKGTVIVDIIDGASDRLIWRSAGQAMATLKKLSSSERKQRIDQFIQRLLSGLPEVLI